MFFQRGAQFLSTTGQAYSMGQPMMTSRHLFVLVRRLGQPQPTTTTAATSQFNHNLVRLASTKSNLKNTVKSCKIISSISPNRSHVTSSRHSAEATFVPPTTFETVETVRKIPSLKLPQNMKYNKCPDNVPLYKDGRLVERTAAYIHDSHAATNVAARPLVMVFAWMLSKDSHIEKYRHFWYERGFDVFTVQTSPMDLLLPSVGGARNAEAIYKFLTTVRPTYDEILLHTFSVGGYQLSELLDRMQTALKDGDRRAQQIYDAFRGIILDSIVFTEDAAPGLSRAITQHPVYQPMVENAIHSFLYLTKPLTFDRYLRVSDLLIQNDMRLPASMLYSKDDVVSSVKQIESVLKLWDSRKIYNHNKCWDSSVHVLHYKEHQEEYTQNVDYFISQLNIKKAPKKEITL